MTTYWFSMAVNSFRRSCGCCDWDEYRGEKWVHQEYRCRDHQQKAKP